MFLLVFLTFLVCVLTALQAAMKAMMEAMANEVRSESLSQLRDITDVFVKQLNVDRASAPMLANQVLPNYHHHTTRHLSHYQVLSRDHPTTIPLPLLSHYYPTTIPLLSC
jgi:hypothetical protein